jgi:FkbM family methyltransferase
MHEFIDTIWLKFIRLYTYYSPIRKGKYRLFASAMSMCKFLPDKIDSYTKDGRHFETSLRSRMNDTLFFLGEYERAVTHVINNIVKNNDVCLDIGANFGWYTTLLHNLCGKSGEVHAFEPVPSIFSELEQNYKLKNSPKNLKLVNCALGDFIGETELFVFPKLSYGYSSMSKQGNDEFVSHKSKIVTIDSYLEENKIADVNFIKVDVEGAEMLFLLGAKTLFKQKVPPIFVIEMALSTLKSFDVKPSDLVTFISQQFEYDFFIIDEVDFSLTKFDNFKSDDIGANVLCVPTNFYQDRLHGLKFN